MMIIFILSCIMFCAALGCIIYWVFIKDAEDFLYPSFASLTGMSILCALFAFFGENIFSSTATKCIGIISACIAFACVVIYILRYIFDCMNHFELRLLIFLIPAILSLLSIAYLLCPSQLMNNYMEIVCAVFALIGVLFSITTHVTYKNRENRLKNELHSIERSFRYHRYNTEDYFSREEIYHIEEAIIEVYSMAKRRKISSSRALEIFTDAGISSDLVHRLMDRLYIGKLLDKCSVLTLSDFMSELLPELFLQRRTYRSSSMDIRYLEDFYDKLHHSLRIDNGRGLDEINKKLDALNTYIKKSMHTNTQNSASAETYGRQNQIRELFHALETPIATTEMAIVTLKASFETLTDTQKAKFDRIQDSIRLIKSILFAYRELSSMNIFSDQNTFFSLPEIIESFPEIMSVNDAKIEQYSIPDQIPEYSTNLVVVLLLPLIHNAVEASPEHRPIHVKGQQTDVGYVVCVENFCKQTPRQVHLDTEGYSSKNDHVGTGISIVRRVSKSAGIDFELKVKDSKVSATLMFPKR